MERHEFPSYSKDWKNFKQNNKTIALNILFLLYNTKQIRPAYISKYNFKRDNQVNLLMITDNKNWHYLAIKTIPKLLRGITSNHVGHFHCLNCFIRTQQKRNLQGMKKYAKIMISDMEKCLMKIIKF